MTSPSLPVPFLSLAARAREIDPNETTFDRVAILHRSRRSEIYLHLASTLYLPMRTTSRASSLPETSVSETSVSHQLSCSLAYMVRASGSNAKRARTITDTSPKSGTSAILSLLPEGCYGRMLNIQIGEWNEIADRYRHCSECSLAHSRCSSQQGTTSVHLCLIDVAVKATKVNLSATRNNSSENSSCDEA